METIVQAGEFKAKCLRMLNDVRDGDSYLITKRGVPVAKLSGLAKNRKRLFGAMKNSFVENEDIRKSISVAWAAENV